MKTDQAEQVALYWDIENLIDDLRKRNLWEEASERVVQIAEMYGPPRRIIRNVASCDLNAYQGLRSTLNTIGVQVMIHGGRTNTNESDRRLLDQMRRHLPADCDTVVIGSGDEIFAGAAEMLKLEGKRIEVVARRGTVAADLYSRADDYFELPNLDLRIRRCEATDELPVGLLYGGAVRADTYRHVWKRRT